MISRYVLLVVATIVTLLTGCTGRVETKQEEQPQDTTYTQQAAMKVYDYDPVRALQIVDSAVIVGNLSDWQADKNRARISPSVSAIASPQMPVSTPSSTNNVPWA